MAAFSPTRKSERESRELHDRGAQQHQAEGFRRGRQEKGKEGQKVYQEVSNEQTQTRTRHDVSTCDSQLGAYRGGVSRRSLVTCSCREQDDATGRAVSISSQLTLIPRCAP